MIGKNKQTVITKYVPSTRHNSD